MEILLPTLYIMSWTVMVLSLVLVVSWKADGAIIGSVKV